mgnify:FL=1
MGTAADRNVTGAFKVMIAIMSRVGRYVGMDQPVPVGAKRYLDVALGEGGPYASGRTYTSRPEKMTGPPVERTPAHLTNEERQDTALSVLENLTRSTRNRPCGADHVGSHWSETMSIVGGQPDDVVNLEWHRRSPLKRRDGYRRTWRWDRRRWR